MDPWSQLGEVSLCQTTENMRIILNVDFGTKSSISKYNLAQYGHITFYEKKVLDILEQRCRTYLVRIEFISITI